MPVRTVRLLAATSLVSYPAGALLLALGDRTILTSIAGYGLILLAFMCWLPLINSSLQRIVGDEVKVLDEFELRLRGQAMTVSYAAFSALALVLVMYASVASDKGTWVPQTYAEFSGLFWGIFQYATLLPIAVLSWMVDASFEDEAE